MKNIQTELETTLARLVAIPSESDNVEACRQIIEFVRGELEPLGLHISADVESPHPWLVATTHPTKAPKILLVAHLDVVPAADSSQYELHIDGDKLYGRGAWDMKYAAAGFLELLKNKKGELHDLDLGVMFTTDEEIGGYQGVRKLLKDGWRCELAFIPDYGDNWEIEENAKGLYNVKVSVEGKAAHGSRPWEGDNAIQKLTPLLHELQTVYPSTDKYGPTLSVNMIEGGDAQNQVPDRASAWLDFRAFGRQELDDYKTLLSHLTAERGIAYEEITTGHPLELNKDEPLVQRYLASLQACGITPKFEKSFGATDGRWFAEYDIPCIVTGPHGENAHGPTEWVWRRGLLDFYMILEHFADASARISSLDEQSTVAHTA